MLLLSACIQAAPAPTETTDAPTETSPPATMHVLPSPIHSATASPSPQPSPTPAEPSTQVCSPLAEIPLPNLLEAVTNSFLPPAPGSDDPHQGVDFAWLEPNTRIALGGAPVAAALPGRVAGLINDRFPYGNAVMVETGLDRLAAPVRSILPTPEPTRSVHPALTCPAVESALQWEGQGRSLYLLYAHMQSPAELELSQQVACGDLLGATGDSGNALNPHLHLEARIGPAGAVFSGLAHYETRATPEEMRAYCDWRVSGLFQVIDPIKILGLTP